MSKSLGNYIGITETPEVMFRKVMQIGDSLMFRYYELLTDTSMSEIAALRERIARGELHPMAAKIELGKLIVADFHSAADAGHAAAEFNRVVRQKEVPSDIPILPVPDGVLGPAGIHVDKLVARIGLAESVSEARRRREAGAVTINGQRATDLIFSIAGLSEILIQVGKQWRRVTFA
jgi:tyrosyl-tRNA synthetase